MTNSLNFLPEMDEIYFIENGCIVESGNYATLTDNESQFKKFIETYLLTKRSNTNEICMI